MIDEDSEKAQKEFNNHHGEMIIERARHKFKEKDYKGTLDIYKAIEQEILLSDFDRKTIEYCKRRVQ